MPIDRTQYLLVILAGFEIALIILVFLISKFTKVRQLEAEIRQLKTQPKTEPKTEPKTKHLCPTCKNRKTWCTNTDTMPQCLAYSKEVTK